MSVGNVCKARLEIFCRSSSGHLQGMYRINFWVGVTNKTKTQPPRATDPHGADSSYRSNTGSFTEPYDPPPRPTCQGMRITELLINVALNADMMLISPPEFCPSIGADKIISIFIGQKGIMATSTAASFEHSLQSPLLGVFPVPARRFCRYVYETVA